MGINAQGYAVLRFPRIGQMFCDYENNYGYVKYLECDCTWLAAAMLPTQMAG